MKKFLTVVVFVALFNNSAHSMEQVRDFLGRRAETVLNWLRDLEREIEALRRAREEKKSEAKREKALLKREKTLLRKRENWLRLLDYSSGLAERKLNGILWSEKGKIIDPDVRIITSGGVEEKQQFNFNLFAKHLVGGKLVCLGDEGGIGVHILPSGKLAIYIDLESLDEEYFSLKGKCRLDCPVIVRCFSFGDGFKKGMARHRLRTILKWFSKIETLELWGPATAGSQDQPLWTHFSGRQQRQQIGYLQDKFSEYDDRLVGKHKFRFLENFHVVPFEKEEFAAYPKTFNQDYIGKWKKLVREGFDELPEKYCCKIFDARTGFGWLKELSNNELKETGEETGLYCDLFGDVKVYQINKKKFRSLIEDGMSFNEKLILIARQYGIAVYLLSDGIVRVLIDGCAFTKNTERVVKLLEKVGGMVEVHCFGQECFSFSGSEILVDAKFGLAHLEVILKSLSKIKKFVLWGGGLPFGRSQDFDNSFDCGMSKPDGSTLAKIWLWLEKKHVLKMEESFFVFPLNGTSWTNLYKKSEKSYSKWKGFFLASFHELPEKCQERFCDMKCVLPDYKGFGDE